MLLQDETPWSSQEHKPAPSKRQSPFVVCVQVILDKHEQKHLAHLHSQKALILRHPKLNTANPARIYAFMGVFLFLMESNSVLVRQLQLFKARFETPEKVETRVLKCISQIYYL